MTQVPVLIKVSGHELDDTTFLTEFAATIKGLNQPVIVVHGGGAEISSLQKKLGIEPRYLDGVRITDAESIRIAEMVMCGTVNKRLVRSLINAGLDAFGLSGVDRGLVRAVKMTGMAEDMGFTGSVVSVRGDVLRDLLAQGVTPVVAPICLGETSNFNVNADHVAGAIAAAVEVSRVIFLTNVEGVLVGGEPVKTLTPEQTQALIREGTIFGGMIPKVQTALEALANVPQVAITNLTGLKTHGGTVFTREVL
jgi:acetylglutamate kinase